MAEDHDPMEDRDLIKDAEAVIEWLADQEMDYAHGIAVLGSALTALICDQAAQPREAMQVVIDNLHKSVEDWLSGRETAEPEPTRQ